MDNSFETLPPQQRESCTTETKAISTKATWLLKNDRQVYVSELTLCISFIAGIVSVGLNMLSVVVHKPCHPLT